MRENEDGRYIAHEPILEVDVDELLEESKRSEQTLDDAPLPKDDASIGVDGAQEKAAQKRRKGGITR